MKIHTTIQKWGNSLAIRITGPLKTIPHFVANMPVEIEVSKKGLTIHPISQKKKRLLFNETQLLKGLTPKKAHADEIANIHHQELEHKEYNKKTGLLICCPISSSIRGHLTEVSVEGLTKPSVIASSIIQTLSWQERKAKFVKKVSQEIFEAVLQRLFTPCRDSL